MELVILFWIICGIAAAFVASSRGANGCMWALIGVLLGPIGLLMAFASESENKCPKCKSGVRPDATRCPKCQADLSPDLEATAPRRTTEWLANGTRRCLECHATIPAGAANCPACAAMLCPSCHENVRSGAVRCPACGKNVRPVVSPPETPTTKKCPDCAEEIRAEARKCRFCGYVFEANPGERFCNHCGQIVATDVKFCSACGGEIIQAVRPGSL